MQDQAGERRFTPCRLPTRPAVTFRRKPGNWPDKDQEAKHGAAPAPTGSGFGPAAWAFLASLFVAAAGTIVGEPEQRTGMPLLQSTGWGCCKGQNCDGP